MANGNGGARPGAGRPKGTYNTPSREILNRALKEGITPVEVLLNDMRYFYTLGENKMRVAEATKPGEKQQVEFTTACSLKQIARDCAVAAAPYCHAKLAAVQANVQTSNVEAELAELE